MRRYRHFQGMRRSLWVALCLIIISPGLGFAQTSQTDFTFKKVSPPSKGSKKKINIQVERTWPFESPKSSSKEEAPVVEAENAPKTAPSQDWFWSAISPDLDASDPIRLDRALSALNVNTSEKEKLSPGQSVMDKIIRDHGGSIMLATAGKRVSPALVLAVIAVESGGRSGAKSEKGAQGLMQLIPATAARFGVKDTSDSLQNIAGGVAYLDWLLGKFAGDPILSLAGYNAGENAVMQNNGVPPFAETRAYVPKVVAAWDLARLYCKTIPKFADDGCVFELNRSFAN